MTQHILLDLDDTLSDPKVGITQSIRYALTQLNVNVPSEKRLIDCIGPPLSESFADLLPHPSPKKVTEAIALYRDRFSTTGLFENQLYNNISLALTQLKAQNAVLHLATSKPKVFAQQILEHFELTRYFTSIHGSELDGTRAHKSALIAHVLHQESIPPEQAIMVGDRSHDIVGAIANQMPAVGVLWGFGTYSELIEAGATHILERPLELSNIPALMSKPLISKSLMPNPSNA